jgi:DNA-binding NtrC family response regulator
MGGTLEETARDTPRSGARAPRIVLRILRSPDRELPAEVPLATVPLAIGRAPSAERSLAIRDPRLSRTHAIILLAGDQVVVRDSSTNGSFVEGERVTERALADGDLLRAGDSFFLVRTLPDEPRDAPIASLVGRAPAIAALRAGIALVARSPANVLVVGESGTGKELVARAIHEASGRRGRFVAVNCGAIPDALAESQLFGHTAGAFTGARDAHTGFFRQAHEGTLFLDEIGEMSPVSQAKLLCVLEDRAVQQLGADRPITVDVRVVSATNKTLQREARAGRFRGDLFARISDLTLTTPPLRDRREDVLPILERALGAHHPELAPDLVDALLAYDWPFNVRELAKVGAELALKGAGAARLELAMVAARLRLDESDDDDTTVDRRGRGASSRPPGKSAEPIPGPRAARPSNEEIEAAHRATNGNVSQIARVLGRSRRQVRRYLESLGLRSGDDE